MASRHRRSSSGYGRVHRSDTFPTNRRNTWHPSLSQRHVNVASVAESKGRGNVSENRWNGLGYGGTWHNQSAKNREPSGERRDAECVVSAFTHSDDSDSAAIPIFKHNFSDRGNARQSIADNARYSKRRHFDPAPARTRRPRRITEKHCYVKFRDCAGTLGFLAKPLYEFSRLFRGDVDAI